MIRYGGDPVVMPVWFVCPTVSMVTTIHATGLEKTISTLSTCHQVMSTNPSAGHAGQTAVGLDSITESSCGKRQVVTAQYLPCEKSISGLLNRLIKFCPLRLALAGRVYPLWVYRSCGRGLKQHYVGPAGQKAGGVGTR